MVEDLQRPGLVDAGLRDDDETKRSWALYFSKFLSAYRAYGVELRPRDVDELYEPTKEAAALDDDACLAAIAVTLFGDKSVDEIPGGYSADELSADSPLKRLKSFPQALVLMGRAAVIIRGIASKLEVNYSLADAWEQAARAGGSRGHAPPRNSAANSGRRIWGADPGPAHY